jgi:hypothetical protein
MRFELLNQTVHKKSKSTGKIILAMIFAMAWIRLIVRYSVMAFAPFLRQKTLFCELKEILLFTEFNQWKFSACKLEKKVDHQHNVDVIVLQHSLQTYPRDHLGRCLANWHCLDGRVSLLHGKAHQTSQVENSISGQLKYLRLVCELI